MVHLPALALGLASQLGTSESVYSQGSVTPLAVTREHSPEMLADLRFHLSWLFISSCVFSGSDGTETELAKRV